MCRYIPYLHKGCERRQTIPPTLSKTALKQTKLSRKKQIDKESFTGNKIHQKIKLDKKKTNVQTKQGRKKNKATQHI